MRRLKKILIIILSFFLLITVWHYFKNPITIEQEKGVDVPVKFHLDVNDKGEKLINVYIPYKITVQNNRLKEFRMGSFDDENNGYGKNLAYNTQGMELNDFYNNLNNETFSYTDLKYKETIFPFFNRTFYYYKKHSLVEGKLKSNFNFRKIEYDEYYNQLQLLSKNIKIPIEKKIIDSLYKSDDKKRFNIYFYDNRNLGTPMFIETKFNSKEQIFIDIYDSIKDMNKEEMIKYVKTNLIKRTNL